MGTSLVLEVTGQVPGPKEGVSVAAETIDSGRAADLIDKLREHFLP